MAKTIKHTNEAWKDDGLTTVVTDPEGNVLWIYDVTDDPGGGAGYLWMAKWKNHHTTLDEIAVTLPAMWVAELKNKGVKI